MRIINQVLSETRLPRRSVRPVVCAASALVAMLLGGTASPAFAAQPNIVFIMSDDQDMATMQYMPRVQELLAAQGVTFENSFVTSPICCPSNVTALTGQYTFNHGVLNNLYPTGGFQKFVDMHRRRPGHARRRVHARHLARRRRVQHRPGRQVPGRVPGSTRPTSRRGGTSGTAPTTASRVTSTTA